MNENNQDPVKKSLERWQALTGDMKTPDGRMNFIPGTVVKIRYTNWQGVTGERLIIPEDMYFGENEYHKGEQWLVAGFDLAKQAGRTFAMNDLHQWTSMPDVKPSNLDKALAKLSS
jgi:hypothetical protein